MFHLHCRQNCYDERDGQRSLEDIAITATLSSRYARMSPTQALLEHEMNGVLGHDSAL